MSSQNAMEENLENKRKKAIMNEVTKATITGHFSLKLKFPMFPPIFKEGRSSSLN